MTLDRAPLLAGLLAPEVERVLAASERRTFAPGEVLFREDDPGGDLLLVEEGTVTIRVRPGGGDGPITLVDLGPGDAIGEVSLVDEGPRSAEAEAKTPVAVRYWRGEALRRLFEAEPRIGYVVSTNIGRIVAARIRGANALLLYRAKTS